MKYIVVVLVIFALIGVASADTMSHELYIKGAYGNIFFGYNPDAKDVTYNELMQFLKHDNIYEMIIHGNNADYSITLQQHAENAGIRCGIVYITFADGSTYTCNVFRTTEPDHRGGSTVEYEYIDATNNFVPHDGLSKDPNSQMKMTFVLDNAPYNPHFMFQSGEALQNTDGAFGKIVQSHEDIWTVEDCNNFNSRHLQTVDTPNPQETSTPENNTSEVNNTSDNKINISIDLSFIRLLLHQLGTFLEGL